MGNTRSVDSNEEDDDIWWTNNSSKNKVETKDPLKSIKLPDEFELEMVKLRERRHLIISAKKQEMESLRNSVKTLQEENAKLKELLKITGASDIESCKNEKIYLHRQAEELRKELYNFEGVSEKNRLLCKNVSDLQQELQDLRVELSTFVKQREEYVSHVNALKEIIKVSKQLLFIKEEQVNALKSKANEIEAVAAIENQCSILNLKQEYEKQLKNMKDLRLYYEQRRTADNKEKMELKDIIEEHNNNMENELTHKKQLLKDIEQLENENSIKYDEIKNLESNLGVTKAECRQYQAEMTVVNQLFSQFLLGFGQNHEIDIDKLGKQLEDNHDILHHIFHKEICDNESIPTALPKVFLNLLNDMYDKEETNANTTEDKEVTICASTKEATVLHTPHQTAKEIVDNLPKVWKILIELLSFYSVPRTDTNSDHPCYKFVETSKGPDLVLSVSQTFIRLKDLILEKRSLEKETLRLKQLNIHLESRLEEQENRLQLVSSELTQTWDIVGQLQEQHQLLHTQESILRYELAEKRKLLNELKAELEISRQIWMQAREKNLNTEKQWKQLSIELASRRLNLMNQDNNSGESGFSDEIESCTSNSDDEEKLITEEKKLTYTESNYANNIVVKTDECSIPSEPENPVEYLHKNISNFSLEANTEIKLSENIADNSIDKESEVGVGSSNSVDDTKLNFDEAMLRKDERLKRLELMTSTLVTKVVHTNRKSEDIEKKLDKLHGTYGSGSNPNNSDDL